MPKFPAASSPSFLPQASKVLYLIGRRPLWRAGICDACRFATNKFQGNVAKRSLSTWMQDADELSKESGKRRLSGRIHILGLGNVGTFVAHSLASRSSPPPVTLLLHKSDYYKSFLQTKKCLSINSNGLDDIKTGFDVDVFDNKTWHTYPYWNKNNGTGTIHGESELEESTGEANERIECLVVTVKAHLTASAIESVSHRLTPDSTVLFLQNGMGTIDEVNEKVFPDPGQRPHYMAGIISHGLAGRKKPYQVAHTGVGTTILGPVPPSDSLSSAEGKDQDWAPSTKYLLRTLTLAPQLVAVAETPSAVMLYQLEKLAMNCIINPLTAAMDLQNGELLYNYSFTRIMRLLLIEISSVIVALPELQGVPGIESRFSPERLRWMVTQLLNKTAKNHSSMLQDVWNRKTTEIEFMNGYIVRRGEELGMKCVVNYMIQQMVLAKLERVRRREYEAIPMDHGLVTEAKT